VLKFGNFCYRGNKGQSAVNINTLLVLNCTTSQTHCLVKDISYSLPGLHTMYYSSSCCVFEWWHCRYLVGVKWMSWVGVL